MACAKEEERRQTETADKVVLDGFDGFDRRWSQDALEKLKANGKHADAYAWLSTRPASFKASFELSIVCYYLGKRAEGQLHATVSEFANKGVDPDLAARNTSYYLEPLEKARVVDLRPTAINPRYYPCNPSILKRGPDWLVSVRTVNYRQDRGNWQWRELERDYGGYIMSTNFLIRLDGELRRLAEAQIEDPPIVQAPSPSKVKGMEDLRLFEAGGEAKGVFFLANCANHGAGAQGRQAVVSIGDEVGPFAPTGKVAEMASPTGQRLEKNWLPFLFRGRLVFIYCYDPLTLVNEDGDIILERYCPYRLGKVRGSAGPIPYKGGHLVVVHQVAVFPSERIYYHRLLHYDADFQLLDVSKPFAFEGRGIEFCAGLATQGDDFLFAYGVEDREARLAVVQGEVVAGLWLDFPKRLAAYLSSPLLVYSEQYSGEAWSTAY